MRLSAAFCAALYMGKSKKRLVEPFRRLYGDREKEKPRQCVGACVLFTPPMAAGLVFLVCPPLHTGGKVGGGGVWYLDQFGAHCFRREVVPEAEPGQSFRSIGVYDVSGVLRRWAAQSKPGIHIYFNLPVYNVFRGSLRGCYQVEMRRPSELGKAL